MGFEVVTCILMQRSCCAHHCGGAVTYETVTAQVLPNGAIQYGDPADGGYTIPPEGSIHAASGHEDNTK